MFGQSMSDTGRRPGFLFGDYSKRRQRYLGVLPCLRPLPRLSAAPSESPTLQRARHRAPFGNEPWPAGSSNDNGLELAEGTVWSEPVSGRRTNLPQKVFPIPPDFGAFGRGAKKKKTSVSGRRASLPQKNFRFSASLGPFGGGQKGKKEKPRNLENNPMR